MKLSYRLETIASFVAAGSRVADIGTDHGYIPIYLIENGIARTALAMDVGKGPLERAQTHIKEQGLADRIETRLSDGLTKLCPGEADTVIIAGMGGSLIIHILEEGHHLWDSIGHFILSPQSDITEVRRFLADRGFSIYREAMVKDEDKYYTVLDVQRGPMKYERERDYRFGRYLIEEKNAVLAEYLEKEKQKLTAIADSLKQQGTGHAAKRLQALSEELLLIEETQNEMQ